MEDENTDTDIASLRLDLDDARKDIVYLGKEVNKLKRELYELQLRCFRHGITANG